GSAWTIAASRRSTATHWGDCSMDSGSRRAGLPLLATAIAATALSALCWWHGTGLRPLWWAAWLAPLPLLLVVVRLRAHYAALATFTAFALGGANQWAYLHEVIRVPLPVTLVAILVPALAMIPVVLLFRALARQGRPLAAALAMPAAATGLSWLVAQQSPHGTYGHLAYSQLEALPLLQLASLGGLWAVGFAVWWGPSAVAAAMAAAAPRRMRLRTLAIGALAIALALGFGAWRLQQDAPGPSLHVALLAIGGP